ncbi:hypothetical protein A3K86_03640 [Photobacterium jeanii]|uniref:Uncharacterized protein n=1 Tax=Photobacterium jeanii TaxID=858640 RepID=A0A178KMN8_9GAMM|nr:hypothetical protein [Photobacterium jeanii]OAN18024.1 hypothetical protein A3K86_03640 [Photobacterium jeanii]PST92307.1 hypothetical protein C9I91_03800 [Photobacterium jeanii]
MIRNRINWLIRFCHHNGLNIASEKVQACIVAASMTDSIKDAELVEYFMKAYQSDATLFMKALQMTDEYLAIQRHVNLQLLLAEEVG